MGDMAATSIGIDIGGTFTDVVVCGPAGAHILKLPTTSANPGDAVIAAVRELRERDVLEHNEIARLAHGTTIATNAVLERKGAKVGLIATEGFDDVLELGRQIRHQLYDLVLAPETPGWLAPGALRIGIRERLAADGSVVDAIDHASVRQAVEQLLAADVEAIAVCLLFSFRNLSHEHAVREIIADVAPDLPVSLSCEVDPAFREYERTVVTAFDAYIKPRVSTYLKTISEGLHREGIKAPLQIMQSRGGLAGMETAQHRPVRLFLSGPAAGVLGGAAVGEENGLANLVTIDVGGTSSDIALVTNGQPMVRRETDIGGYQVRVPMLDVTTLGAGGGSIAWIDSGGGLRVGPQSAGAEPGPACYGRGGSEPTVTDASIVLGYLDPDFFAGGRFALDRHRAIVSIEEHIAKPLGISVEAAAIGIHRIANAHMADGIRLVSVNRGHDVRDFTLVALGGAGGLHVAALADELDVNRVLIPRYPGVLSAGGLLAAPIEHEFSSAFHTPLVNAEIDEVRAVFETLDCAVQARMEHEQVDGLPYERVYAADVGYRGQSHFLEVAFQHDRPDALARLYDDFEASHERINGLKTGAPAAIVNLRVVHRARLAKVDLGAVPAKHSGRSRKAEREVRFPHSDKMSPVPVHDRALLGADEALEGPAIIEQDDTTTLLPAGWTARVVSGAALLIERRLSS
ncbi:MAG: hydantoinase/oxoprolinase family protein [Hyphomicrobiaceae bacterium]